MNSVYVWGQAWPPRRRKPANMSRQRPCDQSCPRSSTPGRETGAECSRDPCVRVLGCTRYRRRSAGRSRAVLLAVLREEGKPLELHGHADSVTTSARRSDCAWKHSLCRSPGRYALVSANIRFRGPCATIVIWASIGKGRFCLCNPLQRESHTRH
jgi:hypothetical protein